MPVWLIVVVVVVVVAGFVGWLLLDNAVVRVEAGQLGLLMIRGRATDKVLEPGPHLVLAIRRRMVEPYPSLEMAYRAGATDAPAEDAALERAGPALSVVLGDRNAVSVAYTVRFRLDLAQLRSVHERFGPEGIWAATRDVSGRAVRATLCDDRYGLEDLFGPARRALEDDLGAAVGEALAADGLVLVLFGLGDIDLGRAGELVHATARARYGLAREEAEMALRTTRARHDAQLESTLGSVDSVLRYREVDAWQEVALTLVERGRVLPGPVGRSGSPPTVGAAEETPEAAGTANQAEDRARR